MPADNKREAERVSVRLQTTITGWPGWAVERLAAAVGQSTAEVGSRIVNDWVESHRDFLKQYGVTFEEFSEAEAERVRRVVRMSDSRGTRTNE